MSQVTHALGRSRSVGALLVLAALSGCGGATPEIAQYVERLDRGPSLDSGGRLSPRWSRRLAPDLEGPYLPIERSVPCLDGAHDRMYVGSSAGQVWALNGAGGRVWMYQAGGGIGAEPTLSLDGETVYVGSDDGFLHALRAHDGSLLWRTEMRGALGDAPLATDDAVYIATENDVIEAFDRASGDALWRYERQAPEGFYVTEHAGLTLSDRRLLAGFTDGAAVALDPSDGRVLWVRDTAADLAPHTSDELRFTDVDTTPLAIDGTVYVASFAGAYALEPSSGSVRWLRNEWTGVTGISAAPGGQLILSSGDHGVVAVRARDGERLWATPVRRGAPTATQVVGDLVVYGENEGGLVALTLGRGREVGRLEDGHGFAAEVALDHGLGAAISNTGTLFVFAVR
ncbi:MAG: PQQ-binding-like beta-propeller repeat protein [Sandaracinus sp.]